MSPFYFFSVYITMDDIEIMQKCLSWEMEYFWKLYDKYIDKIYKYIYLKTSSKDIAEDITSDVFLSAINKINTFKIYEWCSAQAWLYKIACNKVIDFYRTNKETEEIWDYLEMSTNENFWENLDNKEKLKEVFNYLKTFKKEYREIFILRIWDWLSYSEISEITWKSIDNCKQIISRIIKAINTNLIFLLLLIIIF